MSNSSTSLTGDLTILVFILPSIFLSLVSYSLLTLIFPPKKLPSSLKILISLTVGTAAGYWYGSHKVFWQGDGSDRVVIVGLLIIICGTIMSMKIASKTPQKSKKAKSNK